MKPRVRGVTGMDQSYFVKPFDDWGCEIEAQVIHTPWRETGETITYTVNWPAIGPVDSHQAREFAQGILEACTWLEKKRREGK